VGYVIYIYNVSRLRVNPQYSKFNQQQIFSFALFSCAFPYGLFQPVLTATERCVYPRCVYVLNVCKKGREYGEMYWTGKSWWEEIWRL
jgi:hypothetical protein